MAFYWDKQEQRYFIRVPKQIVSGVSVDALLDDEELTMTAISTTLTCTPTTGCPRYFQDG